MGPLRGGLILAALAQPARAAGVCDTLRPDWDAALGPGSGLMEAYLHLTSLPGLALLGMLFFAFHARRTAAALGAALLSVAFGLILYAEDMNPESLLRQGQSEGCIGPTGATYATLGVILLAALVAAFRSRRPA